MDDRLKRTYKRCKIIIQNIQEVTKKREDSLKRNIVLLSSLWSSPVVVVQKRMVVYAFARITGHCIK